MQTIIEVTVENPPSIGDQVYNKLASYSWNLITFYVIGYVLYTIMLCVIWGYVYRPSDRDYYNRPMPWTNREVIKTAMLHAVIWPFHFLFWTLWGAALGVYIAAKRMLDGFVKQAAKALPQTQRDPGFQLHSKLFLGGAEKRDLIR